MAAHNITPTIDYALLSKLAIRQYRSPHTKRIYTRHLERFQASGHTLDRMGVLEWLDETSIAYRSHYSQIQALAAVKALVKEAVAVQALDYLEGLAITSIKIKRINRSAKHRRWLTLEGIKQLMALPDRQTDEGKRDAAVLVLLLTAGLRRSELCALKWTQVQEIEGRTMLVDIVGKGRALRTIPIPAWASAELERWRPLSTTETVFAFDTVGAKIYEIVCKYSYQLGIEIRPHDFRRTLAQMLRHSGAPIEQIQLMLGHKYAYTTESYMSSKLITARDKASVDFAFSNVFGFDWRTPADAVDQDMRKWTKADLQWFENQFNKLEDDHEST